MTNNIFKSQNIAIIIPYYNASEQILNVVNEIPNYISKVIIVVDAGTEKLPKDDITEKLGNDRMHIIENEKNLGVGGATKKGMQYAINHNIDIVVKVDADDQMDMTYLPELLKPIINDDAKMTKGNRFRDIKALRQMPILRRIGNTGLSFLIKIATGYWHNFDPTNGYFAISTKVLKEIDTSKLSNRYYFETSLLAELYFHKIDVKDISIPAKYGNEVSNMNLLKMFFLFLYRLPITFLKRIIKEYFLYDFNVGSVYLLFGLPLFLFGSIFGAIKWHYFSSLNVLTPTGTIMVATLTVILGFQLILQFVQYDIFKAPKS